jgi:hypothetical protein
VPGSNASQYRDPLDVNIVSGGGGGGGAATIADGADVAQGSTGDASTANTVIGRLKKLISLLPTALGSATSANSLPVVIASDQAAVTVIPSKPATATLANVASSASSVTLQASNAARMGWSIFNDSTSVLYLKYGTTASATSYTVQIPAGGYFEVASPVYTGRIDGIWAAANGNARVTELTA